MKTTALVTALAVASVAAAAPTPTNPDGAIKKKDASPDANSDDTFTHMLIERDCHSGEGGIGMSANQPPLWHGLCPQELAGTKCCVEYFCNHQ